MNKTLKIFAILMVAIMLVSVSTSAFAKIDLNNIKSDKEVEGNDKLTDIGSTILTYITNIGMIASVIIIALLGIKYMISSSEGKAEYKKNFMPLLVGAILLFGATTIAKIITSIKF